MMDRPAPFFRRTIHGVGTRSRNGTNRAGTISIKGANRSPTPVHMKNPDQPSHCIRVRRPASTDLMSASAMFSTWRPRVIDTNWPSKARVPFLVAQVWWLIPMRGRLRSRRATPSRPASRENAYDQQQNYRAGKGHDHVADDRVAEYLHLDVE